MSPKEIVNQMFSKDSFSQWLGVQIQEVIKGRCVISLQVSNLMTNGFKIAHGGIAYSLADSCAAFVANSFGFIAITKSSNIYYLKKVNKGDHLTAHCATTELDKKNLEVEITNQHQELVANYSCTIHYTNEQWTS